VTFHWSSFLSKL